MTGFHFVAISQFYEDWQNLFHICKKHNIFYFMFGNSIVQYSVQTAFGTVCRLSGEVIIPQAVDPVRFRCKVLLEVIFIIVPGRSPTLLDVPVCRMSIPLRPCRNLASTVSFEVV